LAESSDAAAAPRLEDIMESMLTKFKFATGADADALKSKLTAVMKKDSVSDALTANASLHARIQAAIKT